MRETIEKRANPRYEVSAVADIAGEGDAQQHPVRNISLGGISLESADVQDVGTLVTLVIRFPELAGASLAVQGQVVWVNREPPIDMGIRFLDLDDAKRRTLREFLARGAAGSAQDPPR